MTSLNDKKYSLGVYEKAMPKELSWEEKLLYAKEANYDFIEISIDETDEKLERLNMSKEERLGLLSLSKTLGLPIHTMCLSGHRKYPLGSVNPEIEKKSIEIMEKAIQLADDLGVKIIQLAGYDVYYENSTNETQERFCENLKKITKLAAKYGIVLGFETMETSFMNTVEKALKYVNIVDSAYLNIYPDLGNITNAAVEYNVDVLEDLKLAKGNIVAMHLKETVPGKFREIPFGTGHVDFESAIAVALEIGVNKFVTEFWYTGNECWKEDLVYANEKMSNILNTFLK